MSFMYTNDYETIHLITAFNRLQARFACYRFASGLTLIKYKGDNISKCMSYCYNRYHSKNNQISFLMNNDDVITVMSHHFLMIVVLYV